MHTIIKCSKDGIKKGLNALFFIFIFIVMFLQSWQSITSSRLWTIVQGCVLRARILREYGQPQSSHPGGDYSLRDPNTCFVLRIGHSGLCDKSRCSWFRSYKKTNNHSNPHIDRNIDSNGQTEGGIGHTR